MIYVYHNPRCGKSRECISYLSELKLEFEIISYLKNPPTFEELKQLINKLGIKPIDLVRKKEKIWIENFKSKKMNDVKIIEAMVNNPILIERPIVIKGEKAVVARPFSEVDKLI